MNRVHLHGNLAQFGGPFRMDIANAAEAIRALSCMIPPFASELRRGSYRVLRGTSELSLDTLSLNLGRQDVHIIPVLEGAGDGKAKGKAILGIALLGAAFFFAPAIIGPTMSGVAGGSMTEVMAQTAFTLPIFGAVTFGKIAGMGLMMALGGVSKMLAPQPGTPYDSFQPADQKPSFIFSGPLSSTAQGGVVPVGYGRFRVGATIMSAGLRIEDTATDDEQDGHKGKAKTGKDPSQFAHTLGWWKSDTGVTKDGSNLVSSWTDQSGKGRTLSYEGGKPLWVSGALSGSPSIRFDGVDDAMKTADFSVATPLTVFLVAKIASGYADGDVLFATNTSIADGPQVVVRDLGQARFSKYANGVDFGSVNIKTDKYYLWQFDWGGNENKSNRGRVGSAVGTSTDTGTHVRVGGYTGAYAPFDLVEMSVHAAFSTKDDGESLSVYYENKYGLR